MIKYQNYYHQKNSVIRVTYDGKWYKEADYIKLSYSSGMESLVVFFCNNNTVSPILRVYHDKENIISSIIEKACSLEVLDLSEYYPSDDTDFSE